jgi:hypothetical protein
VGGVPKTTAIALAFSPAVMTLKMDFLDGSQETISLRKLNIRQAKKARLEQLRYTAFAVRGPWCPKHLASYDAHGRLLWESAISDPRTSPSGVGFVLPYKPSQVCPRASGAEASGRSAPIAG